MAYLNLPPSPDRTPGGMPVKRRRPDGTRSSRHGGAEEPQPARSGAIARIAGRLIRAFRTRS
jgi:hypothetical protein